MTLLEQLETVEHGTLDGFRDGCRGGAACPAVMSCRDVHTRWSGDYGFRRRMGAGVPVAVILADEAAAVARPVVKTTPKPSRQPSREPKPTVSTSPLLAKVEAAHADGLVDRDIADRVGCGLSTVGRLRRSLELDPNVAPKAIEVLTATHGPRVRELHAQGWNDGRIGKELGTESAIRKARGRKVQRRGEGGSASSSGRFTVRPMR